MTYVVRHITIRPVENGYIIRCEKGLDDNSRKRLRAKGRKVTVVDLEREFKSEELVADDLDEVLSIVKKSLKGVDQKSQFAEGFDDDDEG